MVLRLLAVMTIAAAAPVAAEAQSALRIESRDEALVRDAAEYARRYAVPPEQAAGELRAQIESVSITDALSQEFAGRLLGITIDHAPRFGIGVLLTGDEAVVPRTVALGGIDVPIVFRTGARATHSALVSAIERYQGAIRASLLRPPGIGIDARTGELLVLVSEVDVAGSSGMELGERLAAMTGVPVRVELAGAPANMMIGGGSRVIGPADGVRYVCTTGFAVTDGTRDGVATAAHCPDELSYVVPGQAAVAMPFVSQFGWGYQDVQINASPAPIEPRFFADSAKTIARPVEAAQGRASTRAGDFVCHRGERTGYSCAEVLMTDFAPAGDLCGGACLPTWVAVEGPTCRGGDSGAPVFAGTIALGLVKGGTYRADGSCAMYYYMSVDYLPPGWSLLEAGAAGPLVPIAPELEGASQAISLSGRDGSASASASGLIPFTTSRLPPT